MASRLWPTDVERSDCVYLLLDALQRLDHESHIPGLNHTCVQLFSFAQDLNHNNTCMPN